MAPAVRQVLPQQISNLPVSSPTLAPPIDQSIQAPISLPRPREVERRPTREMSALGPASSRPQSCSRNPLEPCRCRRERRRRYLSRPPGHSGVPRGPCDDQRSRPRHLLARKARPKPRYGPLALAAASLPPLRTRRQPKTSNTVDAATCCYTKNRCTKCTGVHNMHSILDLYQSISIIGDVDRM